MSQEFSKANERILKLDCENCSENPSIARTPACMNEIFEHLKEQSGTNKILLNGRYVQEYKDRDLTILKEFARVLQDSRYQVLKFLTVEDCGDCEEERKIRIEDIWHKLQKHPLEGVALLKQLVEEFEDKSKYGSTECKECRKNFLEEGVRPALDMILNTSLCSEVNIDGKGREKYESLFRPVTRPSFLRSKLKLDPPEEAELTDAYDLSKNKIRIYYSPERLEYIYFIIPPEYRLPPKHVEILQKVRGKLLEKQGSLNPEIAKEEVERRSRKLIMDIALENDIDLSRETVKELSRSISKFTAGFGIVETLLEDPKIQDIYIDAPVGENPIYVYHQDFEECLTNIFFTSESAKILTSKFRALSGRPFSEANPTLDLNLENVRVAAIQNPLSPEGVAFAIRRHKSTPWTLPQFIDRGFLTPKAAGLLSLLVDSQASILITGSRGAGKTSLLGALILELLPKYRILCLEDTAELPIEDFRSLGYKAQRLQVRPSNSASGLEMTTEEALRSALRLGESVLIMGEVRGPETESLYEAMRVGAAGNSVMGTIHGSSTKDVFERVVYDLGIPPSSFKATDVIAVASPIRKTGSVNRIRRLTQVTEVGESWKEDPLAEDGFTDLLAYDSDEDELRTTPALENGESTILESISRKWSMDIQEVQKNFEVRSRIHGTVAEKASQGRPELLEAEKVVDSNLAFHRFLEEELRTQEVDYDKVFTRWKEWFSRSCL